MELSVNTSAQFIVKKRVLIYLLCIIILETFCFVNSFVVDLKGASIDAERFQYKALYWIDNGSIDFVVGAELYIQLLGMFFSVFGPYEFIASQISVLCLVGSAIYFEKILKLYSVDKAYYWALPLMLWPSLITRATTTMREPILIFFSVLFVYFMLKCVRSRSPKHAAIAILFLVLSAFLHKAYAVLLVFLLPYIVFGVLRQSTIFYKSKIFFMRLAFIFVFLGTSVFVYSNYSNIRDIEPVRGIKPAASLLKGDSEYMQGIVNRKSSREFRSTYNIRLDFSSFGNLVSSAPNVLAHYLFGPFPWNIQNFYDVYAFLEGVFRLVAIVLAAVLLFSGRVTWAGIMPVLVFLFILSAIWAFGTTNYGTASRHHTTTNWVYLMFVAMSYQFRFFLPEGPDSIGKSPPPKRIN